MKNAGFVYRSRVGADAEGESVLDFLTRRHRHSDRHCWQDRIQEGRVRLDGRAVEEQHPLRTGQLVEWHRPPWQEPEVPRQFAVLYRDEHCLVVAKPAGLPSVPAGGFLEHTLLARVQAYDPAATPMHRHGRFTSGVALFARTRQARRALQQAWRDGAVTREYLGLAEGVPERRAFTIDQPIGPVPHPRLGTLHAACAEGRPARSHVEVREDRGDQSLVAVRLHTGRPHQIRIHLASVGHPLVGDPLYVAGGGFGRPDARPGDPGYHLHAWRLGFPHPRTAAPVTVECAPPSRLRATPPREPRD